MSNTTLSSQCQCPTAPQIISDNLTGEVICRKCGVVLESNTIGFSVGHEVNTIRRHDYGIGTAPVTLKLEHRSSQRIADADNNKSRKIKNLFLTLEPILQRISATHTIDVEAHLLVKECVKRNLTSGRKKVDLATACVIVACKIHGKSIAESEIISTANASRKNTRRIYRTILQTFDVTTMDVQQRTIKIITRICGDLAISQKTMKRALALLERIKSKDQCVSSNPGTVAGTVVYLCCPKRRFAQHEIAKIAGVTDVSLRNFRKRLDDKDLSIINNMDE